MKKILSFILFLIITGTFLFTQVIEVGGANSEYTTIKSAIFNAKDGDVIRIFAGNYVENLRFSKSITLEGVNTHNVVLKPLDATQPTIMVENCNQLTISGMTINGETIAISLAMTNATIKGNKIYSKRDGIRAGTLNHEIKIINNQISGQSNTLKTKNTNGLMLVGVGKTTLENNDVSYFDTGMYLGGKKPVKISENQIHSNALGIYAAGNTQAIISNNRIFENNNAGILLVSKPIVTISSNYFSLNERYDILLSNASCGEFLINFTGTITGNSNQADGTLRICPEDYSLPEDFQKGS